MWYAGEHSDFQSDSERNTKFFKRIIKLHNIDNSSQRSMNILFKFVIVNTRKI